MKRLSLAATVAAFVLAFVLGSSVMPQESWAGEFRFVVQDMADDSAAWFPIEVIVHRDTDGKNGMVFILDNPTQRTHVFEAPGLLEWMVDEQEMKPLRITVAPEESVRVEVSVAQSERMPEPCWEEMNYRFFCPLHQADSVLAGVIRVVP